jgi:PAS domain S-box-containing protein
VIQTWNEGAHRLFGYTAAEAIGQPITLIIPPELHSEEKEILRRIWAGERIEHFETERVTKDGRKIQISLTISPIRNSAGKIIGASKIARNITDAKRFEEAIREYAGRQAAILHTVVDGIVTIDGEGIIESVNPAAVRLFGYAAQEMVGQNVRMLTSPSFLDEDGYLASYLQTGETGREVEGRRKDGSTFPMEMAVSETMLGKRRLFTGIMRDITARKEAERALRETDARLRIAVQNAPLLLFNCDRELRYTWVADEPHPDFSANDMLGRTPIEVFGEAGQRLVDAQRRVLSTGFGERVEFSLDTSLGRQTWDVALEPLRDSTDKLTGLTGAALEITERKQAEERQQLLLAELSHRVKNTLATVQSVATQTAMHSESIQEFRKAFDARLHSLAQTHGLLTRSRWKGAELKAIVLGEMGAHGGVETGRVKLAGPSLYLAPRAALSLHLVLHELATNAAKYGALSTPEGQVDIQWSLDQQGPERVLRLFWIESGGPKVVPPARRGFGTTVIENSVEYELDGETTMRYLDSGLCCELTIPWGDEVGFAAKAKG